VCEILEKEETQRIRVYTAKKKFKKLVTIVEGIRKENLDKTAKDLKHVLACGGTAKEGVVILQGDQKRGIKKALVGLGYPEDNIEVE
jgi:translation initiation factor 1